VWQWLIRSRLRATRADNTSLTRADIESARSILFAVFARYGDSIIAFKAIDEFISRYPEKRYQLITTHQALPYARALVRHPIEFAGVNKRRNPLLMWRLTRQLRREPPDLGFNPWSHGAESEYFVSFCRKFSRFGEFARYERNYNLYRRPREYLTLPEKDAKRHVPIPASARQIVLVPFSTDIRKGLDRNDLETVVTALRRRFRPEHVVVAGLEDELTQARDVDVERFVLGKTRAASERFIELLRSADLFVGVDTGPLHLADALSIPAIGLLGPTAPETVLDRNNAIAALRHPAMQGTFCDVLTCRNPVCLHRLCATLDLDHPLQPDFNNTPRIEKQICVMPPEKS
jgi:ADP-heptose:LPS heptosyltransferase